MTLERLIENVRLLDAEDLGIGFKATAQLSRASSAPDSPFVASDDPLIRDIARLAPVFGGVILSGPPGTSKSYYAGAAAQVLTGDDRDKYRFIQFHASYQYEDFMVGFAPTESGFKTRLGPFLDLAARAREDYEHTYVLVIDELSRADVGRVFGEALTYVDRTKRELPFTVPGIEDEVVVPVNLIILATMNPFDRGVDEVDAAFERRFAKISMDPDRSMLDAILTENDVEEGLKRRIIGWFDRMNNQASRNPAAAVGQAYFANVTDEDSLTDAWEYQLKYLVRRAFRRDPSTLADMEAAWSRLFLSSRQEPSTDEAGT